MLEIPIRNLDISHCPLFMSLLWRPLWAAGKMCSTWSAWLGINSPECLGEHDQSSWLLAANVGQMEGEAYSHTGWINLFQTTPRTSLVAQWRGVCLPMQRTWVRSVVWEASTCHGAVKSKCHNSWASVLEPGNHNYWSPRTLEPVIPNKRSHHNKQPVPHNDRAIPIRHN